MSDPFKKGKHVGGQIDPVDLAKYVIVKLGGADHLKLQKLLYYIQSWHLVLFDGAPLFEEDFRAWVHGPVLISVWNELKDHSKLITEVGIKPQFVPAIIARAEKCLQKEQVELIDDVLEEYGNKTGYHLECLTHSEDPWKNARGDLLPDEKGSARISKSAMRKFYAARLAA
ncbi:MAG: DUF4065 domain-containing protein [Verrucomicrobia bacterium]|nr:DUF4065 domain-containing protein [Verrucomicrobiota bacterium]MBV8484097.1 DUF4065 domain-containing protein [Verrucomicrobiota bacterium]